MEVGRWGGRGRRGKGEETIDDDDDDDDLFLLLLLLLLFEALERMQANR